MKKFIFYLLGLKKMFYIFIYPLFMFNTSLCKKIRLSMESYLVFQPARFRAVKIKRKLLKKYIPQRFVGLDGTRLYGWYIPPKASNPVILYLHGQSESILTHQDVAEIAIEKGLGLFMLSYRGHYKSWGIPSEEGVYRDAQTAIHQLKRLGINQEEIFIWGHSLGTAVALQTARYNNIKGLILQSPIKDLKSAAIDIQHFYCRRLKMPFLVLFSRPYIKSIKFLSKFDSINKISQVKCPILIVHPKTDKVTPFRNAIELAKRNPSVELFISQTGSHWSNEWCRDKILEFINK